MAGAKTQQRSSAESRNARMKDMARCGAALVVLVTIGSANALAEPQVFPSPGAAAQALREALEADDGEGLRAIFGPEYADDLIGSDIAIVREEMRETREAMRAATALLPQADGAVILTIGRQAFPFPVPIVGEGESWYFDSAAGMEEILDRRIGENELAAIETLRAYVEAQIEYASADRDGDQVLEYAQQVISTPGERTASTGRSAPGEPSQPVRPVPRRGQHAAPRPGARRRLSWLLYRVLKAQDRARTRRRLRVRDQRQHDRRLRHARLAGGVRRDRGDDVPGQPPGRGPRGRSRPRDRGGGGRDRCVRSRCRLDRGDGLTGLKQTPLEERSGSRLRSCPHDDVVAPVKGERAASCARRSDPDDRDRRDPAARPPHPQVRVSTADRKSGHRLLERPPDAAAPEQSPHPAQHDRRCPMKTEITRWMLVLGAICLGVPAIAQTPAQDVSAAMQGELGPGCNQALTDVGVE